MRVKKRLGIESEIDGTVGKERGRQEIGFVCLDECPLKSRHLLMPASNWRNFCFQFVFKILLSNACTELTRFLIDLLVFSKRIDMSNGSLISESFFHFDSNIQKSSGE